MECFFKPKTPVSEDRVIFLGPRNGVSASQAHRLGRIRKPFGPFSRYFWAVFSVLTGRICGFLTQILLRRSPAWKDRKELP